MKNIELIQISSLQWNIVDIQLKTKNPKRERLRIMCEKKSFAVLKLLSCKYYFQALWKVGSDVMNLISSGR